MKEKLKKFKTFTKDILPHEVKYLKAIERFSDPEKKDILDIIDNNAHSLSVQQTFDTSIDKRKYSALQKWMKAELDKIDVDKKFIWITNALQHIMLDNVSVEQETQIIKSLQLFDNTSYYFVKHYEMLLDFRQYLLIRKRYIEYKKVNHYLNQYQFEHQRSILINQQMDQATKEIIGLSSKLSSNENRWENWLLENFKNDHLDGLNRYLAFVRLSFIYLNQNKLNALKKIHNVIFHFFETGKYYSRRLLLNFYDNSLVLCDRKKDYEKAYYYGRLSIKGVGPDQLLYRNNFINVLIKQEQYEEALNWINDLPFKISEHKDYYSVIGFVSNHIRCLTKTNQVEQALNKANVFWKAYSKQILEYRWYRFFLAYLEALFVKKDYSKIIRIAKRNDLLEKEEHNTKREQKNNRSIKTFYLLAQLFEGEISKSKAQILFANFDYANPRLQIDKQLIAIVNQNLK